MGNKARRYPSDVSDEEWAFCVPYLTLMNEQAPQRKHALREIFNALRWLVRAGFDGHKKRKGSKVHAAVDTLGHLLALKVTPANEQDRAQVAELTLALQEVSGEQVEVVFVDQG